MQPSLAIIVPTLDRPHRVEPLVISHIASEVHLGADACLYFVVDPFDEAQLQEIDRIVDKYPSNCGKIVTKHAGPSSFAHKCNVAVWETTEDWLLFVGDDVSFSRNWFAKALKVAKSEDARFISTNDMVSPYVSSGVHAVHPLIRRDYVDEGVTFDKTPHIVACEQYGHWFVDNEWTYVAKADGEYAFAKFAVIRHHHPIYDRSVAMDATYQRGQGKQYEDLKTWERRLAAFQTIHIIPDAQ